LRIVDIIPASDSAETDQNSEPSIGVNPVDLMQMFAGTFGTLGSGLNPNPFFSRPTAAPRDRASASSTTTTNRSRGRRTDPQCWLLL